MESGSFSTGLGAIIVRIKQCNFWARLLGVFFQIFYESQTTYHGSTPWAFGI